MPLLGPMPRFRLYARAADYRAFFGDLLTGRTDAGADVERLERALAARCGSPHVVAVPQARVGVYLALRRLVRPGQRVVLSPYTIADVVNMVICAGGVPVFADIDRATTNIRVEEVARLIDADTGAVLITHLHGIACDVEAIADVCRARGVALVEDAAQAFGARVAGRLVGTFGAAGIFSFGMYKNITAFYGGAVVTRDEDLARAMREDLGAAPPMPFGMLTARAVQACLTDVATHPVLFRPLVYWIFRFGHLHDVAAINRFVTVELDASRKDTLPRHYLCRMRAVQARMVLRQLDDVERQAEERIRYARLYHEALRDLPDLLLPPYRDDGSCVYNYVPVQYADRAALVRWVMQRGRDLAVQHLKNCADLPAFASERRECPEAAATARSVILLPNYPGYGQRSVRQTSAAIRSFFEEAARDRG
ncbi:MAG: hypothetical protein FJW23_09010 [Acidimicrobiia bacterium]|nr:hypothetical protein [Acidimicrobiia bacterium]